MASVRIKPAATMLPSTTSWRITDLPPPCWLATMLVAVWPFVRAVSVPTTGVLSQQTMDHYATLLKQYGFLPSSYTPPAALANTSLVTGAYKALGQTAPTSPINSKYTSVMNDSRIALG